LNDPADLPYTRAVILETLRLYPAAPVTTRNLEKPLTLRGANVELPAGMMVYIPIWSIQRDARNYPHPQEFRPDRWVKQTKDGTWVERFAEDELGGDCEVPAANRDAFCAFSGGARNCVGRVLAMQEAVTLLAFLLRDLKFECLPGYELKPTLSSFIQKPNDDLPMIIKKRDE
jgi:cytochrome P450